jgi:hypothetical protein
MRRVLLTLSALSLFSQTPPHVPRAKEIVYPAPSEVDTATGLRPHIERYQTDRAALSRYYPSDESPQRLKALRTFNNAWLQTLANLEFPKLTHDAQVDHLLLNNIIRLDLRRLRQTEDRLNEVLPLLPFAPAIYELQDNRVRVEPPDSPKIAATLFRLEKEIAGLRKEIPSRKGTTKPATANRAARLTRDLQQTLKDWNTFYNGYDPNFSWWTADPFAKLNKALDAYADDLREKLAGVAKEDKDSIVGDPIGDAALRDELKYEIVPYTPEDLVKIAEKEFAWCDREMLKASRELGFGDDWKKALEHVKTLYVPPASSPPSSVTRSSKPSISSKNATSSPSPNTPRTSGECA